MKKLIMSLLLALCVGLTGCGSGGDSVGDLAEQPVMLEYRGAQSNFYGVINSEGTMIIPLEEREPDSIEILSISEQQYFALEIETIYPEGAAADDGEYLIAGQIFRFYDPWGRLVHEQLIELPQIAPGNSIEFWLGRDGSLENSRFLLNTFAGDGGYHILDAYGRELVAREIYDLDLPLRFATAAMELDEEMMVVNYSCYFEGLAEGEGAELYSLDGEPLDTARGYQSCWRGWNVASQSQTDYYLARYTDDAGYYKYDLLDAHGQVLLSGLDDSGYSMGEAMIVSKDGVRGLMNLQGEWLYQEPYQQ